MQKVISTEMRFEEIVVVDEEIFQLNIKSDLSIFHIFHKMRSLRLILRTLDEKHIKDIMLLGTLKASL